MTEKTHESETPGHSPGPVSSRLARWGRVITWILLIAVLAQTKSPAATTAKRVLRRYTTKYYTIYTDLDEGMVREAAVRMTAMGNEYARRVRGFGPKVMPPLRHSGLRLSPARARPVPFWRHGFASDPRRSHFVFVEWVPRRRLASYITST